MFFPENWELMKDTPSAEAVLKIWHLDRLDKKTKGPHLHSTINIHTGSQPFPVVLRHFGTNIDFRIRSTR